MLQDRRSDLLIQKINELRQAFKQAIERYPFIIDGIVVLPDHFHLMMTLPPDDANYSQRLGFIKSYFSRQIELLEPVSLSRKSKRERGIWQRQKTTSNVQCKLFSIIQWTLTACAICFALGGKLLIKKRRSVLIFPFKISMSGYRFFLEIRGSGNLEK